MITRYLATDLIKILPRWLITTGSYRRGLGEIHDLDFLTLTDISYVEKFFESLEEKEKLKIQEIISVGKSFLSIKIKFKDHPLKVDIWKTTESSLPFAQFSRTGSKKFNIRTRAHAKRLGYRLTDYGLYKGNKALKYEFRNEKDIFNFLGITYKKPEQRNE